MGYLELRQCAAGCQIKIETQGSALSQTIRHLESRLVVQLLNRTTRSVAPTRAGSRLHERVAPMISGIDVAVAEAIASTGRTAGTLRINTVGMAAKKIIAPRLGRFHRAHPDVVLDIVIDDSLGDIIAGRFDVGIRVGERLEKDMIAVRLTPDVKMLVLASPDYLSRCGEPRTPADLHRHACINWRFPGSGRTYRWQFEKRGKRLEMPVEGPLISNHQDVVIEGALQGLGILYAYDDDRIDEATAGAHDARDGGSLQLTGITGRRVSLAGRTGRGSAPHPRIKLPRRSIAFQVRE